MIKHAKEILRAGAVIGVPVTGVLSGWAAISAHEALKEADTDDKFEQFKIAGKYFILPVIAGGATIAAGLTVDHLNKKEIVALSAGMTYLVRNRDNLGKKLAEYLPKEEVRRVQNEMVYSPQSVEETGKGDLLCLEGYSGRWFRSSKEAVDRALNNFTDMIRRGEAVCLNDLYQELGITQTHFGYQMGIPGSYGEEGRDEYMKYQFGINIHDDIWLRTLCEYGIDGVKEPVYVIEPECDYYFMECWMEY